MKYCNNCGSRLDEDEKTCHYCGEPQPTDQPQEDSTRPAELPDSKANSSLTPHNPGPAPEGKKGLLADRRLVTLLLMSGLVVVLLILFFWFFFIKDSKANFTWSNPPEVNAEDIALAEQRKEEARIDINSANESVDENQPVEDSEEEVDGDEEEEQTGDELNADEQNGTPAPDNQSPVKHFSGTFNGSPAEMTLDISSGRGTCSFEADGVMKTISLRFRVGSNNEKISITQYSPEGENIGRLDGVLRNGVFSGNGSSNGESASFTLYER